MSQITFSVDYPQSFRSGVSCPLPPRVTIDVDPAALSADDRELIAGRLTTSGIVQARRDDGVWGGHRDHATYAGGNEPTPVVTTAPTIEALCRTLRESEAVIAGFASAEAARKAAIAAADRQESLDRLANPVHQTVTLWLHVHDDGRYTSESLSCGDCLARRPYSYMRVYIPYLTDVAVRMSAEAQAAEAATIAQTEANSTAARAEAQATLQAVLLERAEWIAAHGSPRLKRLSIEGIGCQETYRRERDKLDGDVLSAELATARPGWAVVNRDDLITTVRDVSSRTLALLDAARKMDPSAKLARSKSRDKYVAYTEYAGRTIVWPQD